MKSSERPIVIGFSLSTLFNGYWLTYNIYTGSFWLTLLSASATFASAYFLYSLRKENRSESSKGNGKSYPKYLQRLKSKVDEEESDKPEFYKRAKEEGYDFEGIDELDNYTGEIEFRCPSCGQGFIDWEDYTTKKIYTSVPDQIHMSQLQITELNDYINAGVGHVEAHSVGGQPHALQLHQKDFTNVVYEQITKGDFLDSVESYRKKEKYGRTPTVYENPLANKSRGDKLFLYELKVDVPEPTGVEVCKQCHDQIKNGFQ